MPTADGRSVVVYILGGRDSGSSGRRAHRCRVRLDLCFKTRKDLTYHPSHRMISGGGAMNPEYGACHWFVKEVEDVSAFVGLERGWESSHRTRIRPSLTRFCQFCVAF